MTQNQTIKAELRESYPISQNFFFTCNFNSRAWTNTSLELFFIGKCWKIHLNCSVSRQHWQNEQQITRTWWVVKLRCNRGWHVIFTFFRGSRSNHFAFGEVTKLRRRRACNVHANEWVLLMWYGVDGSWDQEESQLLKQGSWEQFFGARKSYQNRIKTGGTRRYKAVPAFWKKLWKVLGQTCYAPSAHENEGWETAICKIAFLRRGGTNYSSFSHLLGHPSDLLHFGLQHCL